MNFLQKEAAAAGGEEERGKGREEKGRSRDGNCISTEENIEELSQIKIVKKHLIAE